MASNVAEGPRTANDEAYRHGFDEMFKENLRVPQQAIGNGITSLRDRLLAIIADVVYRNL
jgi:hypothetical protein